MTNQEKIVTWGLMAFIAWELYRANAPAPSSGRVANPMVTNIPIWVQQLSRSDQEEYIEAVTNGGMANEIFDNLLSIPQGPGGGSYLGVPIAPTAIDFFNPTTGMFSMCR